MFRGERREPKRLIFGLIRNRKPRWRFVVSGLLSLMLGLSNEDWAETEETVEAQRKCCYLMKPKGICSAFEAATCASGRQDHVQAVTRSCELALQVEE